jgi:iron complex transport system permease protein
VSDSTRRRRTVARAALLAAGLGAILVLALGLGASPAGFSGLVDLLLGRADAPTRAILLDVRLPRILLAAVIGAALSGAGTAFQAILRNPLADPYILGVSGGAALGAALFIAIAGGDPLGGPLARPVAAFAGALVTLVILFRLARLRGRTGSMALLLVGVVLNAFDSAVILFLVTVGDTSRFLGVMSFLVGAVGSPSWAVVLGVLAFVGLGLAALMALSHRLNLLAFGEETAEHLGVDVERTTWAVVVAASLVTAAAVAFAGLIGFVGLIVPHAMRIVFGSDHRVLVPASAVGGAAFLVLADTGARTLAAPVELPVGVLTALIGCPLFLVLFLRRLRES